MKDWLRALLPPYNMARLFAFTREKEKQAMSPCLLCALKDEMIADLREQAKLRENYTLSLLGQRPINLPQPVSKPSITATAGGSSLRGLRRSHIATAVAKAHEDINTDGMADRADEYAARIQS